MSQYSAKVDAWVGQLVPAHLNDADFVRLLMRDCQVNTVLWRALRDRLRELEAGDVEPEESVEAHEGTPS